MTEPLRFAVVGCGMLARMQHIPNIVRSGRMTLQVCCDLSDENLAICKDEFAPQRLSKDYREAINDPAVDAVCLATTEKLRLPVIEAAAEAGKPVYVEKPLARTLEEMLRIGAVVEASGIPFCIGHNRRSAPALIAAQQVFRRHMDHPQPSPWRFNREGDARPKLADDGVPGMSVRINDDWHSWKSWVFDPEQAPHGAMLFEMTHFTDVCNWFMDDAAETVVAIESGKLNHGVVIRYKGGAIATITMCSNGTFGYPKELYEVMGQGAMVAIDHLVEVRTAGIQGAAPRQTFARLGTDGTALPDDGRGIDGWLEDKRAACERAAAAGDPMLQFDAADPDKGHARQLERFVDQIRGDGPEVCGVREAINASRVAFAAVRSAAEGRLVQMAEIPAL